VAGSLGYQTSIDIANRALQHCRMHRIASFNDSSANAKETGFVYDKLREAELRSNIWRFAIKRAILRPIVPLSLLWIPPDYSAIGTYAAGAVVQDSYGEWWVSKIGGNLGTSPAAGTIWAHYSGVDYMLAWDAGVNYFTGELVQGSDTFVYMSLIGQAGNDPTLDIGINWLLVNGTVAPLTFLYPIGTGPATDLSTHNVFRLPHGFLRKAPTNPKSDLSTWLGAPSGNFPEDWVFEDDYIVSFRHDPMLLRYVQNIVDVPLMSPEFCEILAARIAEECAPILATADVLPLILQSTRAQYKDERHEAIRINGIELAPVELDLDSYITCRF
jgi:hypothetical protein